MDSKQMFHEKIFAYYQLISNDRIPRKHISRLSSRISEYYFEQYKTSGRKYPKSEKRYSTFLLSDLDHPYTHEIVIKYFKDELKAKYAEYSKIILEMNESQLRLFEANREDFENMW
ncbi:MAG: hypothetical protein EOO89_10535 [Pedobacter sp.]|nr:MAG: hypothetical protein EOO89_10535 [Pedobacter sp.]